MLALNRGGYGLIEIDGERMLAHRVSYVAFNGPIPDIRWVCHCCDTPCCVRPDHLFLGNAEIDSRDMVAKGRSAKGEKQHLHQLTWNEVREIRAAYAIAPSSHFLRLLAKSFGVSSQIVRRVVTEKTWKEEPVPKKLVKGFHDNNPLSPIIITVDGHETEVPVDSEEYGKLKQFLIRRPSR